MGAEGAVDGISDEHPQHAPAIRQRLAVLARMGLLPVPIADPDAMPERLGEFRILQRLGAGGAWASSTWP